MTNMGIRRKDMRSGESTSPKSEKDYDKEIVRPEISLRGPHAVMMGAEDLKTGDRIRQTIEWVVKDHVKREESGKEPEYEMTLCIDKASDCVECESEKEDGEEKGEYEGDDSPAMAFIRGNARSED
jgi:hypothetical protein